MSPQLITTLDDPRLEPYRELKKTNLTRWSGKFIAEGEKVVRRLLESDYQVDSVLLAESSYQRIDISSPESATQLIICDDLAAKLVGFQFHAGVMACGLRKSVVEQEFFSSLPQGSSLLVACDRVTDPDNLGTIIRLCTAFGIQGLILGPGCADPFTRRTLRVSMGNAFTLPMLEVSDLQATLKELQSAGQVLLATMLHPQATPLEEVKRPLRGVVLLGNESHGLSETWFEQSDEAVVIPMSGGTDSLNVSVATGIILHYLTRLANDA